MKIKHFAGYGSVTATKLSKKTVTNIYGEKVTELKVRVQGNHECGLERNDSYDLYHWLVKRFDKNVGDYYDICGSFNYTSNDYYLDKVGEYGLDVEVCDYTFTYKTKED